MNVRLDNSGCKKTAILESTLLLIREHGFHGTPMSQIAKSACVAASTIYHYFDSKDELIKELYVYVMDRLAEATLKDDHEDRPYRERFLDLWVNQCSFFIKYEAYLYFLEQYINSPYTKLFPANESKLFTNKVKPFIQYGIDNGLIRKMDYELLGPIVHGSITTAAKFHLSGNHDFTRDRLYGMAEVIWDGIKAQPGESKDENNSKGKTKGLPEQLRE